MSNASFVADFASLVADNGSLEAHGLRQGEEVRLEPGIFTFEFVVHGVLILLVGLLGLLGNIACLAVLSLPGMKNTINCLLTGLVIVDIVILLSAFTLFTLPAFQVRLYCFFFFVFLLPLVQRKWK